MAGGRLVRLPIAAETTRAAVRDGRVGRIRAWAEGVNGPSGGSLGCGDRLHDFATMNMGYQHSSQIRVIEGYAVVGSP